MNVASRLSGLAAGQEILAAASTCANLDMVQRGYAVSEEQLLVRGRSEPITVYRIAPGPVLAG